MLFFIVIFVIVVLIFPWNYLRAVILALQLQTASNAEDLQFIKFDGDLHPPIFLIEFQIKSSVSSKPSSLKTWWLLFMPMFLVQNPNYIKILLRKEENLQINTILSYVMKPIIGSGLLTSDGERWRTHRRWLTVGFTSNELKRFIPTLQRCAQEVIANMKGETENINILDSINSYVLKVVFENILGIRSNWNKSDIKEITMLLRGHSKVNARFLCKILMGFTNGNNLLSTELFDVIKQQLQNYIKHGKLDVHPSMLEILCEEAKIRDKFTEDDIVNELLTLIHASHETTRSTIGFIFYHIAKYPEVQQKIYEELSSLEIDDSVENITENLNKMVYLDQCIKETMRMFSIVPFFGRKAKVDIKLDEKITIPKGANICFPLLSLHRNPSLFPEPDKFDPDRFSKERVKDIEPYSYLPFSTGRRNCIGNRYAMMSIKIFISHTIRKYKLALKSNGQEIKVFYNIVILAKGGIWVELTKRGEDENKNCCVLK